MKVRRNPRGAGTREQNTEPARRKLEIDRARERRDRQKPPRAGTREPDTDRPAETAIAHPGGVGARATEFLGGFCVSEFWSE